MVLSLQKILPIKLAKRGMDKRKFLCCGAAIIGLGTGSAYHPAGLPGDRRFKPITYHLHLLLVPGRV